MNIHKNINNNILQHNNHYVLARTNLSWLCMTIPTLLCRIENDVSILHLYRPMRGFVQQIPLPCREGLSSYFDFAQLSNLSTKCWHDHNLLVSVQFCLSRISFALIIVLPSSRYKYKTDGQCELQALILLLFPSITVFLWWIALLESECGKF
jgi:hypothetical protein